MNQIVTKSKADLKSSEALRFSGWSGNTYKEPQHINIHFLLEVRGTKNHMKRKVVW